MPLAPGSGGWGALEIAGRFSIVDLNSPYLTTAKLGSAYTAPGVYTGGTTTYGGGEQTSYGGRSQLVSQFEHEIHARL
jgi:hypothetical protein